MIILKYTIKSIKLIIILIIISTLNSCGTIKSYEFAEDFKENFSEIIRFTDDQILNKKRVIKEEFNNDYIYIIKINQLDTGISEIKSSIHSIEYLENFVGFEDSLFNGVHKFKGKQCLLYGDINSFFKKKKLVSNRQIKRLIKSTNINKRLSINYNPSVIVSLIKRNEIKEMNLIYYIGYL